MIHITNTQMAEELRAMADALESSASAIPQSEATSATAIAMHLSALNQLERRVISLRVAANVLNAFSLEQLAGKGNRK